MTDVSKATGAAAKTGTGAAAQAGTGAATVGSIYRSNWNPDKTALIFKDRTWTYAELDDAVRAHANYFKGLGISSGERVILNMPNSPEFLFTYLGVVRNAAVIVPVNPLLTMRELAYTVKDSGAKYLVIKDSVLAMHDFTKRQLTDELGVKVFVADEAFERNAAGAVRDDFDEVKDPGEISTFLYTSGTTGGPKAAMLMHSNLVSNAGQAEEFWHVTAADSFICVLPMFHVFAFTLCILLPLKTGGTIALLESFTPKGVIQTLVEKEISIFMGVPAMLMVITDAMKKDGVTFPKLRFAAYGGASTPLTLFNTLVELGLPPAEGFGLTEGSPAVLLNPAGKGRAMSCGVPVPGTECRIVDENDEDVPVGEVGELVFRGPNMMKGYYNRPEETAEALRGGWMHTGDIAKKDGDDYYYIVDRKKDVIIVSGLNVYPREVEEALFEHPLVAEAAVIGESDPSRGEVVVAYIVLKEGAGEIHHRELLRFLKPRVAQYKMPRRIHFIGALPRNSSGKVLKRMLREQSGQDD
jgi:long-chain acyl-CoA synthetase